MARTRGTSGRSSRSRAGGNTRARTKRSTNTTVSPVLEEDERVFARPNSISPHLFCVICAEVFKNPYRAPCGHSFCYSCILKWLETAKDCPVDRKPLKMSQLHHDFILENIIGDYKVACPWRALGCSYVGPLCQLETHKKECVMNPDHLPEALRIREKENMKLQHVSSTGSSSSNLASVSSTASVVPAVETATDLESSVNEEGDEDEDLPPAPPPSLLMRLFQKSDPDSRSLLCSFLGEPGIGVKRPRSSPSRPTGNKNPRKGC